MRISLKFVKSASLISSFVFTLFVNFLSNALPLNGKNTAQVSAQYPAYFTPAGHVFSIWGLIYTGLIANLIYYFIAKGKDKEILEKVQKWIVLSNLLNGIWIFAWHYDQIFLSVLLIIGFLLTLIKIYTIIQTETLGQKLTKKFRILVRFPFSLYLGWLSVATVANISALLYFWNWNGFGISGVVWCVIMMIVAGILGLTFVFKNHDAVYPSVIIWAVLGIGAKFSSVPEIVLVANLVAAILAASVIVSFFRKK